LIYWEFTLPTAYGSPTLPTNFIAIYIVEKKGFSYSNKEYIHLYIYNYIHTSRKMLQSTIDMQTATEEELQQLRGIGPMKAKRISALQQQKQIEIEDLIRETEIDKHVWEIWLDEGTITISEFENAASVLDQQCQSLRNQLQEARDRFADEKRQYELELKRREEDLCDEKRKFREQLVAQEKRITEENKEYQTHLQRKHQFELSMQEKSYRAEIDQMLAKLECQPSSSFRSFLYSDSSPVDKGSRDPHIDKLLSAMPPDGRYTRTSRSIREENKRKSTDRKSFEVDPYDFTTPNMRDKFHSTSVNKNGDDSKILRDESEVEKSTKQKSSNEMDQKVKRKSRKTKRDKIPRTTDSSVDSSVSPDRRHSRRKRHHIRHTYSSSSESSEESSTSSDSSMERLRKKTRKHKRKERQRSRSPQLPKMATFTGDSSKTSWEAFISQFERIAERRDWSKRKCANRLFDCLSGIALEYANKLSITSDYRKLKKEMGRRFDNKDAPVSARRKLQFLRQMDSETLEEFSQRVHFLAIDGYGKSGKHTVEQIATETFLRGCREKEAAKAAMEKGPNSIHKALKYVKESLANQRAIFGTKSNTSYIQRQVSFADKNGFSSDSERSPNQSKDGTNVTDQIKQLTELVGNMGRLMSQSLYKHDTAHQRQYQRSATPPYQNRDIERKSTDSYKRSSLGSNRSRSPSPYRPNTSPPQHEGSDDSRKSNEQALNFKGPGSVAKAWSGEKLAKM